MRVEVRLGSPLLRRSDPEFARIVRSLLEAVAQANCSFLDAYPDTPPLYRSGVVYQAEPEGVEEFRDIPAVLELGAHDCASLCAWRVAELRRAGERAAFRLIWFRVPDGRMFHVQVRRGNGTIEDPSALLGMPTEGLTA